MNTESDRSERRQIDHFKQWALTGVLGVASTIVIALLSIIAHFLNGFAGDINNMRNIATDNQSRLMVLQTQSQDNKDSVNRIEQTVNVIDARVRHLELGHDGNVN